MNMIFYYFLTYTAIVAQRSRLMMQKGFTSFGNLFSEDKIHKFHSREIPMEYYDISYLLFGVGFILSFCFYLFLLLFFFLKQLFTESIHANTSNTLPTPRYQKIVDNALNGGEDQDLYLPKQHPGTKR